MHADEVEIGADLVERLVRGRFPQWTHLPVERLVSGGTVNAVYRIGEALTAGGVEGLEQEERCPARLASALPVTIPAVVGRGEPAEGYP